MEGSKTLVEMPDGRKISVVLEKEMIRLNKIGNGLEVTPDFGEKAICFHPIPKEYAKFDTEGEPSKNSRGKFWAGMVVMGFFGRTKDVGKKDVKGKPIYVRPFIPVEIVSEGTEEDGNDTTEVVMPDGRKMVVKLLSESLQLSRNGTLEVAPDFLPDGVYFHPIPKSLVESAIGLEIGTSCQGFYGKARNTGSVDKNGTVIYVRPFIPVRW